MELRTTPSNGDWLVHHHHGVGQLMGRETKRIGGQEGVYYRLDMEKGSIYVPEDNLNGEWFRPVASQDTLTEVKEVLGRPPQEMAQNFNTRKGQILQAMTENSIVDIARFIRDLYGRRTRRKTLSSTEDSLLRKLQSRLLAEWTVASGLADGEAQRKLTSLLVSDRS